METTPSIRDRWQTALARLGSIRNTYTVAPGVYAVGTPTSRSPVLVSANYKLSFDALRFRLAGVSAWILVLDTRGVNVWCAAGKGTFSTAEILFCLERFQVSRLVEEKQLIVPQLGAPSVNGAEVHKRSGFQVVFGPVRSRDLPAFLDGGCRADEAMRTVTFSLAERMVLVPVELYLVAKQLVFILLLGLVLSGIGPDIFSLAAIRERGLLLSVATLAAVLSGTVVVPLLLPWLPGRQFWVKGLVPAVMSGSGCVWMMGGGMSVSEAIAVVLWSVAVCSYLAMNFTGSTPFTSPSGVEYEMKRGLVVQGLCLLATLILWVGGPFVHA